LQRRKKQRALRDVAALRTGMRQCAVAAYVVDILHNASLMSLQSDTAPHGASTTWSGLKGERLIVPSLQSVRSTIEQQLARAGVAFGPLMVLNHLDTIVAMVEAGHGTGILPSHALPACQRRRVRTSRLINPTVPIDFYQIRNRSRKLSPAAQEFTTFLRAYIARWAGRAGLP